MKNGINGTNEDLQEYEGENFNHLDQNEAEVH